VEACVSTQSRAEEYVEGFGEAAGAAKAALANACKDDDDAVFEAECFLSSCVGAVGASAKTLRMTAAALAAGVSDGVWDDAWDAAMRVSEMLREMDDRAAAAVMEFHGVPAFSRVDSRHSELAD